MKKRFLEFVILMAVLCTAFPAFAQTAGGKCGENVNWSYDFDTGHLSISGIGAIRSYTENSLAPWDRFSNTLVSVSIESGVTGIGDYAFYWCNNITRVSLPNSIKNIGNNAFYHCNALTDITIPNSVTSIGEDAFSFCDGITNITIPNSVTSIGDGAFSYCDALTSVIIQSGVKSIGKESFYRCSNLTGITLPDSVTSIGVNAFYNTPYYNDDSEWEVLYIGNHLIKADDWALNKGKISDYTITPGTKTIADSAFYYCNRLTSITVPDSVVSIGNRAFEDCNSLTSITIPKSVANIGEFAFYTCFDLESINVAADNAAYCSENGILYNKEKTDIIRFPKEKQYTSFIIPSSVTSIADGAFEYCDKLTNITIPDSVTSIGDYAFSKCLSLKSIIIPDGVPSIGNYAFYNCSSLKSITIPNSVTSIGEYAFDKCDKLNDVKYIGSEADWSKIKKGNKYSIADNIINYCCRDINVTLTNDGKIIVSPINIDSGTVILALYGGEKGYTLIEMQSETYNGTGIKFTPNKNYTRAKVMVWKNLGSMAPACDFKNIE